MAFSPSAVSLRRLPSHVSFPTIRAFSDLCALPTCSSLSLARAEALQAQQTHAAMATPDVERPPAPKAPAGADAAKAPAAQDFDALFHAACDLRAHIVLSYRNVGADEWTEERLTRFLSLFAFLNSRHSWPAGERAGGVGKGERGGNCI